MNHEMLLSHLQFFDLTLRVSIEGESKQNKLTW
jgi:hypothetical protein